jgi:hypothetical protein
MKMATEGGLRRRLVSSLETSDSSEPVLKSVERRRGKSSQLGLLYMAANLW